MTIANLKKIPHSKLENEMPIVQYRQGIIEAFIDPLKKGHSYADKGTDQDRARYFVPTRLTRAVEPGAISQSLKSTLAQSRQIAIVSPPASGKTTLLRYMTVQAAQGLLQEISNIPVYFELKNYEEGSIESLIHNEISVYSNSTVAYEYIINLLKKGRVMLLLDGLNEMATQSKIVTEIRRFSAIFPDIYILVTSRSSHAVAELSFPIFQLAPLNDIEIRRLIDYWSLEQASLADTFWQALNENSALASLARNPWQLRLMFELYKQQKQLPISANTLTETYLNIAQSQTIKHLSHGAQLLAEDLALYMYQRQVNNLASQDVIEISGRGKEFRPALSELVKNSVLLIRRDTSLEHESVQFVHQLLQEHFCAQKLSRYQYDRFLSFVSERIDNEWWHPVLSLTIGRRTDSQDLLIDLFEEKDPSNVLFVAKLVTEGVQAEQTSRIQTIERLCTLLDDQKPSATFRASNLLAKFDKREIDSVCWDWLEKKSDDPLSQSSLAYVLAAKGYKDTILIDILINQCRSIDANVRYQAFRALGAIDTKLTTDLLIHCMKDEKEDRILQEILSSLSTSRFLPDGISPTSLVTLLVELKRLNKSSPSQEVSTWAGQLSKELRAQDSFPED